MLMLILALGCAGENGECQAEAPSFFVETLNESGAFISDIEVDWGRATAEEINRNPCTLGEEYWECGDGQPITYNVYLGGPGWKKQIERLDVPVPADPCEVEREVLTVTMVAE